MQPVRIGLLGLGTVGQAVVALNRPYGDIHFEIVRAAVRNPRLPRAVEIPLTQDPAEILQDPTIDIVVEVVGGRGEARDWILTALANGKAVVTANKEVMAYDGPELIAASQEWDTYLGYEASVGGGIPILDALKAHLNAAPVVEVGGVLNGTTNYLLNQMAAGQPFQEALADAQARGFAEADPSADISGQDAVRKLVLLVHLAFGPWLDPDQIPARGLEAWPPELLQRLQHVGLTIRLWASSRREADGRITAEVSPVVVPQGHPAFGLKAAQNAASVKNTAGDFWLEGPGAGGLPTATSIWADIRRSQNVRHPLLTLSGPRQPGPVERPQRPMLLVAHDPDRQVPGAPWSGSPSIALAPSMPDDSEGLWAFPLLS